MDQPNIFRAAKRRMTMETPIIVPQNRTPALSSGKRQAEQSEQDASLQNAKRHRLSEDASKLPITASPADLAFQLFQENGFDLKDEQLLLKQLPFIKPTPEMINAYEPEKISVVRKQDMEGVRALHQKGESFDACNRFGESLIHMASRRGCKEMVEFLVREAKVTLFVRDDYGRNVLHDAFWTAEPNFDLITLLISEVPEFLCVRDVRGHTPLNYVRKGDFSAWCEYLHKKKDMLIPRYVDCTKKD